MSTLGTSTSNSNPASSTWCRLARYVASQTRTEMHICRIFWSSATPLSNGVSPPMLSSFVCFPFPSWGRRNSGFIKKRTSTPGQNKCPAWEDIKFPADRDGIHPRSLGEIVRIHTHLSSSWDGQVARAPKLLQWANDNIHSPISMLLLEEPIWTLLLPRLRP